MASALITAAGGYIGQQALAGTVYAEYGYAIGSLVAQAFLPSQSSDTGRLQDLKYGGSSFGVPWPRVWGKSPKIGGQVIWVKKDSNGNHLRQEEIRKGGSKVTKSQTVGYNTYATFAVAFCLGEILFPDPSDPLEGEFLNLNHQIEKVWANDALIYDRSTGLNTFGIVCYGGSQTQNVDPTISAAEGSANASAHRGLVYFVAKDKLLDGTQIENYRATISTSSISRSSVIRQILRIAGVPNHRIDTTEIDGQEMSIQGFSWDSQEAPRRILEQILLIEDLDILESDGKIKIINRGSVSPVAISRDWLGMAADGSRTDLMIRPRIRTEELPAKRWLAFYDPESDSQRNIVPADLVVNGYGSEETIETMFVMTAENAKKVINRIQDRTHSELEEYEFTLPLWALKFAPGDSITIPIREGVTRRARIEYIGFDPSGRIQVRARQEDVDSYTQSGAGSTSGNTTPNPRPIVTSTFWAGSLPEISEEDQSLPGFYVGAFGGLSWSGAQVWFKHSSATDYIPGPVLTTRNQFGVAQTALANFATADGLDTTNTVRINLLSPGGFLRRFGSTSDDSAIGGVNSAWLGNEIISFVNADIVSQDVYDLSRIYRGRRGTVMTGHTNTDNFFMADDSVVRVSVPEDHVGSTYHVKVVSFGQSIADVAKVDVVIAGRTKTKVEQDVDRLTDDVDDLNDDVQSILDGGIDAYVKNQTGSVQTGGYKLDGTGSIGRMVIGNHNNLPSSSRRLVVQQYMSFSDGNGSVGGLMGPEPGGRNLIFFSESEFAYTGLMKSNGQWTFGSDSGGRDGYAVSSIGPLFVKSKGSSDSTTAMLIENSGGSTIGRVLDNGTLEMLHSIFAGSTITSLSSFRSQRTSSGIPWESTITGSSGWSIYHGHTTEKYEEKTDADLKIYRTLWKNGRITYGDSIIDDGIHAHQFRGKAKFFDDLDVAGDFKLDGSSVRLLTNLVTVTSDGTSAITLDASESHSFYIIGHQNSDGTFPAGTNTFITLEAPINAYDGQIITIHLVCRTNATGNPGPMQLRLRRLGTSLRFRISASDNGDFYTWQIGSVNNGLLVSRASITVMFIESLNSWVHVSQINPFLTG